MKKCFAILLAASFFLSGCNILEDPTPTTSSDTSTTMTTAGQSRPDTGDTPVEEGTPVVVDFNKTDSDMFTDRDGRDDYDRNKAVVIALNGNSVSCNSPAVRVDGTIITICAEGTYILRGKLTNGSVVVNAKDTDKVQLVLDGAEITSKTSAALYAIAADKVFVTLAADTSNTLSNGGSFNDTTDGAVFARTDLTFNGTGSLKVESPAGHGIVCKDDLAITGGIYTIQSASHGVDVNDSFRAKAGSFQIDAGKDGIHAEDNDDAQTGFVYISGGSFDIQAEGDGISSALSMQLSGCTIDILAGGGHQNGASHSSGNWGDFMGGGMGGPRPRATSTSTESSTSMKGLKAKAGLMISSGTITIDSADDGIHSSALAVVNGGNIKIATGDDGVHADTDLTITAGTVDISTSYEGLEAVNVRITGGKISMVATDDGINAAGGTDSSGGGGRDQMFGGPGGPGGHGGASDGSIVIDGGDLYIQSSGDGMDANGYLEINGGKTVVCGPNSGDTATLDFDTSGTINGGTFIGTGSSFMAQTFSANQQGVIAIQAGKYSNVTITVTDQQGNVLLTHQPALDFSVFIYSTPELVSGQTYHVTIGTVESDIRAY